MTTVSTLNLNPTQQERESFGDLAYVTFSERQRVMNLPKSQQERYLEYLKKRLDKERRIRRPIC